MNRYLVSVTTPNYVPKAVSYINSLSVVVSAQPVIILLDFTPATDPEQRTEKSLRGALHWVDLRPMAMPANNSFGMVQHCFLNALPDLKDDDLIILSDMDIVLQRDLTEAEWAYLEGATASGRLLAYWNAGPTDSLWDEAHRIGMTEEQRVLWGTETMLKLMPCRNCGVMVGRKKEFLRMQRYYEAHCEEFYKCSSHRSRCQFLINWVVNNGDMGFDLLPESIHCHGHFRCIETGDVILTEGHEMRLGTALFNGRPVVFRHCM